ncbi:MAG: AEC family transporter [Anaerolineae bacterium]|nr:AEC family transporter [Anaerolineae bacterium]
MTVLLVFLPIFALIAIGYLAAAIRLVDARDVQGIAKFVVTVALPVLLFNSLSSVELPPSINWSFLISYYGAALLIYALGVWISKRRFDHSQQEQGLFGLGTSFGNLMLVGFPIISTGLGDDALVPLLLIVSLHSAILLTVMTLLVERGEGQSVLPVLKQTLKSVVRNPLLIGLALGILFNLLSIPIPELVQQPIELLSRATVPCSLIVVGASLKTNKIAGHLAEVSTIVGMKMILFPALVWVLVFPVFHLDPLWGTVAVMVAGMPLGVNVSMFAQKYGYCVSTLSAATVLSTVVAMVSQPLLLAMYLR